MRPRMQISVCVGGAYMGDACLVCFGALGAEGEPVYSLREMDRASVEVWFHAAADVVLRAWRTCVGGTLAPWL
jgi:hypothetical protein